MNVTIDKLEQLVQYSIANQKRQIFLQGNYSYTFNLQEEGDFYIAGDTHTTVAIKSNSPLSLHCTGNSIVNIETYNKTSPKIEVLKNAQVYLKTYNSSEPACYSYGLSRVTIKSYDNSSPYLECSDLSIPLIIVYDHSKPSFFDWPKDWIVVTSDVYVGQEVYCFSDKEKAVESAINFYKNWLSTKSRYLTSLRIKGSIIKICPNVVDFRWNSGTVHLELPGEENPVAWYSTNAHHLEPLTEEKRNVCTRINL